MLTLLSVDKHHYGKTDPHVGGRGEGDVAGGEGELGGEGEGRE